MLAKNKKIDIIVLMKIMIIMPNKKEETINYEHN